MAKKRARASIREGLRRLEPERLRKRSPKGFGKLTARSRDTFGKVATRGREAVGQVRERIPSGEELRERAGHAREWAADQLSEHAIGFGLAAAAVGIAGATLLPVSDRERRVLSSVSERVQLLAQSISGSPGIARLTESIGDVLERARGGEVAELPEGAEERTEEILPKAKAPAPAKKRGASAGRKTASRAQAAPKRARASSGGRGRGRGGSR